ncbi:hypothetical protein BLNAU_22394 [Blattamonas nauphoetae]|uniref:Uncharacterized protein n=1 Tax=Blattamonas nauphoetae TaxID=2049346 RepID=A0ABQ9WT79_9EUKA|nr:hypothetical protein BLNAU_22394 [Blattamonas nauphoetae]
MSTTVRVYPEEASQNDDHAMEGFVDAEAAPSEPQNSDDSMMVAVTAEQEAAETKGKRKTSRWTDELLDEATMNALFDTSESPSDHDSDADEFKGDFAKDESDSSIPSVAEDSASDFSDSVSSAPKKRKRATSTKSKPKSAKAKATPRRAREKKDSDTKTTPKRRTTTPKSLKSTSLSSGSLQSGNLGGLHKPALGGLAKPAIGGGSLLGPKRNLVKPLIKATPLSVREDTDSVGDLNDGSVNNEKDEMRSHDEEPELTSQTQPLSPLKSQSQPLRPSSLGSRSSITSPLRTTGKLGLGQRSTTGSVGLHPSPGLGMKSGGLGGGLKKEGGSSLGMADKPAFGGPTRRIGLAKRPTPQGE